MRCVLVSKSLDLRGYLGPQFMRAADRIEIISHPHEGPATDVRLAVAWHPPDDAFERYPNLQAVCSIGAGVDNILACPSLRPDVDVIRVVDPAQAQMMSGFVTWHVIGHQRRFATYQAQQREERWQRLGLRRAQDCPVGILGFGEIGRRVAADLALLGFPVLAWSRTEKPAPQGVRGFHGAAGLDAMLGQTEVLVNLLPLTPETKGILNRKTVRPHVSRRLPDPGRPRRASGRSRSARGAGGRPACRRGARCVRGRTIGAAASVLATSQHRRHAS